jgi:putative nucleotidyltransferase with HDIG domain
MDQKKAEELIRRLAAALRCSELYSPTHPLFQRGTDALAAAAAEGLQSAPSVVIGFIGDEVVVDGDRLPRGTAPLVGFARDLRERDVEKVTLSRGLTRDELREFIAVFGDRTSPAPLPDRLVARGVRHVTLGRVVVEDISNEQAGIAAAMRVYTTAVETAETLWQAAKEGDQPDPGVARKIIDGLARLVTQDRTSLMALTTLKKYDNYTFTHMVNVSILTMGQARALGVEGTLLREFGLAALMHDIGKVRTPPEILNKPDKLTDEEFTIMKRHVVDGAEILRKTVEIPPLAPIVAFEHHLRLDGTGYPAGVSRPTLNLATMLCGIADVYDAMRSQRAYQQAFPSERIVAVLQRNDGTQFDQHLVRRFVQLLGIYPAGNVVRLDTGEIAIVLRVHAPDPYRPKVKVLFAADGTRLEVPRDVNLWEADPGAERGSSVVAPVNPADYQIDPLSFV